MNITDDTVYIAPTTAEASKIATMLKRQGDMRGFHMDDGTLLIFDSYGNTHGTLSQFFKTGRRGLNDLGIPLIFRLNGEILYDCVFDSTVTLENTFTEQQIIFLKVMYIKLGITHIKLVRD